MLLTFGQEHIKNEVAAKLDSKQCFIHQKPAIVQEIIQLESSNNRATRCSASHIDCAKVCVGIGLCNLSHGFQID